MMGGRAPLQIFCTYRKFVTGRGSAWLERVVRDDEATGSNPVAPTKLVHSP